MKTVDHLNKRILTPVLDFSKGRVVNILYYAAFCAVYLFRFYYTSMFTVLCEKPLFLAVPYYAGLLILMGLSGLAVIDAFLNSKREAAILAGILVIGFLSSYFSGSFDNTLPLCCLIVASRNRDVKPLFLLSVIIGSAFLLSAYYASMNGYIPYLVYNRGNFGILSHAFGMYYRTHLAAHVFFIIMCYAIIRYEKLHLWEYLMLVFDGWLVWRYTAARTASICIFGFLAALGVSLIIYHIRGKWFSFPKWTAAVHICCAVLFFSAVAWWAAIGGGTGFGEDTETLTARLGYSVKALQDYPMNLFGHVVEERGAGGIVDNSIPYFVIDSTYMRLLTIGGILLLIVYLYLMTRASVKAAQCHVVLSIALAFVALHSIVEGFGFRLAYNVLIIYSFAHWDESWHRSHTTSDDPATSHPSICRKAFSALPPRRPPRTGARDDNTQ